MKGGAAVLAALALAACAGASPPPAPPAASSPTFEGVVWRLESLAGAPAPGEGAYLHVEGDTVRGRGFCGRYQGALARRDGTIRIGPVAAVRTRCEAALAEADAAFLGGLTDATDYDVREGRLALLDREGMALMTFRR